MKRDYLCEVETFLEKYNLQKLNQEEVESLKILITTNKFEEVIKKLLTHKSPGPHGFTGEFYRAFKGDLTPILHRLFLKIQEDGRLPNAYCEANIILIPKPDKDTKRKKTSDQYR